MSHKKFLQFEVTRTSDTTICVEYDDRERSWENDKEELTEFAISVARKNGRDSDFFSSDDYCASSAIGPSDSDQGISSDVIPPAEDWMWRRLKSAMGDYQEALVNLVCLDGIMVYRQMTVEGMKMRSITSINLNQAKEVAANAGKRDDDDEYVFDCFRILLKTHVSNDAIRALFVKVFS
jgi:hypothetical protein